MPRVCAVARRALRNDGGGTLYFTPPETFEEEVMGTASDVWAVGCVVFMLLHMRPPFVWEHDSEEMVRPRPRALHGMADVILTDALSTALRRSGGCQSTGLPRPS